MPTVTYDADPVVQAVKAADTTEDAWEVLSTEKLPNGLVVTTSISKVPGGGEALLADLRAAGLSFRWSDGKWWAEPPALARDHIERMRTHRDALYHALYVEFQRECDRLIPPVLARFTDPPTDRMNAWLASIDEAERTFDLPRIKRLCGVKT